MSIRGRLILLSLVFNLIACSAIGTIGFYFLDQVTKKLIGENALNIVINVAHHIDGDRFAKLVKSQDRTDPYYEELRAYLEALKKDLGAKYLYTMAGVSDTELMYVVDGTDPKDEKNFSDLGKLEKFANLSGHERGVLADGLRTYTDIYSTPDWGDLISAYGPVRDAKGNVVGLIGCDFPPDIITEKNNIPLMRYAIMIATALLVFATFISTLLLVNTSFSNPIRSLNARLEKLRSGDLTVDLDFPRKNEIGTIYENLRATVESIRRVITEVQGSAMSLASATDEMSSTTMSTSENITRTTELQAEIGHSITETRHTIGEVAESTDKQLQIFQELNHRILDLSQSIENTNAQTQNSLTVAAGISNRIQTGESDLNELSSIMVKINRSSEEMNHIVAIINEISDKINLLSLNAAIESARAGDAGRGFAVVADEISKLADGTAASIKNIDTLIASNHAEAQTGLVRLQAIVTNMKTVVADVDVIKKNIVTLSKLMEVQLAYRSGASTETQKIQSVSEKIHGLIGRHRKATEEIQKRIDEIGGMSQSNAAASEELAANSEELAALADSMKKLVDVFKT